MINGVDLNFAGADGKGHLSGRNPGWESRRMFLWNEFPCCSLIQWSEQSSHLGPLGELGTVRTGNPEEAEVIYFERLNLISCLSSKEASFVKGMHAPEERTPIRQCRNNKRPSVHSLPPDQGGKGTPSMLSRQRLLELLKLHACGFLSEAAVQRSTVPLLCFCYKLRFV